MIELGKEVKISPNKFGPDINEAIAIELVKRVKGKYNQEFGRVISIKKILAVSIRKINETFGYALYNIKYRAVGPAH